MIGLAPVSHTPRPSGTAARVQPQVGRSVDVSALSDVEVISALHAAQAAEPAIIREAMAEVPQGHPYALLERFCQLFEAARGVPFPFTTEKR
jgi:hypothetical protein